MESAGSSPGKLHPGHDIEWFPRKETRQTEGAVGGSLKIVQHIEELHPFGRLYPHGDLRACLAKQSLHFRFENPLKILRSFHKPAVSSRSPGHGNEEIFVEIVSHTDGARGNTPLMEPFCLRDDHFRLRYPHIGQAVRL